jgi:hypothetical protein
MTVERTHAKWEYDLLGDYGKLVVLYVGLLSVVYKRSHGKEQGNVEAAPALITDRTKFLGATNGLKDYFVNANGQRPHQIRVNNTGTQRRLARFLVETHDRFAAALGENMPEPLRRFRALLSPDASLAKQLAGMKVTSAALETIAEFPRGDADHRDVEIITPFLRLAKACIGDQEEHPVLHGIAACDEFALAAECLGVVEADGEVAWKKTGLFCVVREARGPYTNEVQDINIIVRDLLWLRHCTGGDPSGRVRDDRTGPGGNLGFYFSAFDRVVYEVRNLTIRNGTMMIDAISFMKTGTERSLCLYYPESSHDHALHCREGVLMGTTRDPARSGAWKVLVVRPDWSNLPVLDAQLSVYLKRMTTLNQQEYRDVVIKCFRFVSEALLVGVLYSREWARKAPDPQIDEIRHQFRDMLWLKRAKARRERIFLGNRIDAALGDVLQPILATRSTDREDILKKTIDATRRVLTDNWNLIEPLQLISSGYASDTSTPDRTTANFLRNLVRREKLLDYERYLEEFMASTKNSE